MSHCIGNRLKEERQRLGLSQTSLATSGGVGKSSQVLYEAGKRVPDANYLISIAEIGVDIDYVLFGKKKEEKLTDDNLKTDLLKEIVDVIDSWASQRTPSVSSKVKAELISLFYRQFRNQKIDHEIVSRYLKLVS